VTQPARPPHVQRCTYTESRGGAVFQCKHPDPHPAGVGHYLGIDAEVYGRDLDQQPALWLAAQLRDKEALLRHQRGRIDELTAIAMDLSTALANGMRVTDATAAWLQRTNPTAAATLGLT